MLCAPGLFCAVPGPKEPAAASTRFHFNHNPVTARLAGASSVERADDCVEQLHDREYLRYNDSGMSWQ